MNDDTTNSGGWEPVGTTNAETSETDAGSAPSNAQRVGFCQDCGKPLTPETLRAVGTGVFCEPCLTARVGSTNTAGYAGVPPYAAVPPQGAPTSEPSPVLAAILGIIPGVGAMYNGQFAKAVVHLVIFGLLTSLSENVNGIFGLFVAGWMFYMIFEAYHTAVARRDGLPLPNAFGFNDIGERMGFGKNWGNVQTPRPGAPTAAGPASGPAAGPASGPVSGPWPGPAAPPAATNFNSSPLYAPVNPVPVGTAPDWVGYVPPTAFASRAPQSPAPVTMSAQASRDAGFSGASYAETYTGATPLYGSAPVPPASIPEVHASRIPSAAFWLIGVGVLILIANLLPDWKLTEQWWPPVFFAGLSVWLFTRRLGSGARLVCIIRWPVVLMVLAVMLALHAANVPVTVALTVSVLLIVFGALLLLERTAGAIPMYAPPMDAVPVTNSAVETPVGESPNRAAWGEPGVEVPRSDPDTTKAGE